MSSMEEPDASAAQAPPKGRAKACTACRQVKLKCDAKELYPNPCTRCKAQNLDCRMDPSFKRVPARRQLEEVSNRLINLQRSLGLTEDSNIASAPAGSSDVPRFDRLTEEPDREPLRRESTGQESAESFSQFEAETKFLDLRDEIPEGQWTLGDVTFSYEEILPVFEHFDAVLYRHIPILEPCRSLHELHESNDLLFWTIVLVSCRLFNRYDEIYVRLIPHHRTLLSMRIFASRITLGTVHSLLVLCTWPYLVNSQFDDSTWLLCGLAINMSMVMGLHKPNHGHEYILNELDPISGSPVIRKMTWLACFHASTGMASWLGLPPSISSSSHSEVIESLCQDSTLPRGYRAKIDIQRQVSRITNALDAKLDFRTRYSLIKLYEQDLDRVQTTFEDVWSDELEVEFLGAKLYLFGMAFLSSGSQSSETERHNRAAGAREVLQLGLAAGSKLLHTIANIRLPPTAPGENQTGTPNYVYQIAFFPKQIFRIGAFATFYLIWYLAVDVNASDDDRNLARDRVAFTHRLLYSVKHSPEHIRAAKSIEMMARFEAMAPNKHQAANLLINSRLGASFMYSLNYTEEDHKPSQKLLGIPPCIDVKSGESQEASTPGYTTGKSATSRGLSDLEEGSPCSYTAASDQPQTATLSGNPPSQPVQPLNNPLAPGINPPAQVSPPDANSIFSNAFFQNTTNQNFEFLWQEWDPAVFDDLKMDIDDQMNLANLNDGNEFLPQ